MEDLQVSVGELLQEVGELLQERVIDKKECSHICHVLKTSLDALRYLRDDLE